MSVKLKLIEEELYRTKSTGRLAWYRGTKTFRPYRGSNIKPVTVHVMEYVDNGETSTFTDVMIDEMWRPAPEADTGAKPMEEP